MREVADVKLAKLQEEEAAAVRRAEEEAAKREAEERARREAVVAAHVAAEEKARRAAELVGLWRARRAEEVAEPKVVHDADQSKVRDLVASKIQQLQEKAAEAESEGNMERAEHLHVMLEELQIRSSAVAQKAQDEADQREKEALAKREAEEKALRAAEKQAQQEAEEAVKELSKLEAELRLTEEASRQAQQNEIARRKAFEKRIARESRKIEKKIAGLAEAPLSRKVPDGEVVHDAGTVKDGDSDEDEDAEDTEVADDAQMEQKPCDVSADLGLVDQVPSQAEQQQYPPVDRTMADVLDQIHSASIQELLAFAPHVSKEVCRTLLEACNWDVSLATCELEQLIYNENKELRQQGRLRRGIEEAKQVDQRLYATGATRRGRSIEEAKLIDQGLHAAGGLAQAKSSSNHVQETQPTMLMPMAPPSPRQEVPSQPAVAPKGLSRLELLRKK